MNFTTTLDNTQEVIATVTASDPQGVDVPVTGLVASLTSGDGTFSMNDDAGVALPINQIRLVSGTNLGDTVFTLNVQNAVAPVIATVTMTVAVGGLLSVAIAFGSPTPKTPTPTFKK